MPVTLNPYSSFRDTAEEAMTFHRFVFGGDLCLGNNVSTSVSVDGASSRDPIRPGPRCVPRRTDP